MSSRTFCHWLFQLILSLTIVSTCLANSDHDAQHFRRLQQQQHDRKKAYLASDLTTDSVTAVDTSKFRYLNGKTKPYLVSSLPDFDGIDIGELYSGSISVPGKNGSLFFVFKPSIGKPVDEVAIWFNGGPGCSSLIGFLTENGPYTWLPGALKPEINPYAWSNITNVLWVEYPFGAGFSQGPTDATDEETIAAEFVKWFKNWQTTFGIKNYKVYTTGESYAGRYVPYVAQAMLNQKDKTYFNLSGALIYDGVIGGFTTHIEVPIVPIVQRFQNVLNLNSSTIATLNDIDQKCGYKAFRDKYMKWPPAGQQPSSIIPNGVSFNDCDISDAMSIAAFNINPCFNIYGINTECPFAWDQLDSVYSGRGAPTPYFNRPDVKKAMHAPSIEWAYCTDNVFANGDNSVASTVHALPQVIEGTNRVAVVAGSLDALVGPDGALLAIQNMTWNGKLGFQSKPSTPVIIDIPDLQYGTGGPQGQMGVQHYERGLLYSTTALAPHQGPQGQPRSSLVHLEWMLGRRGKL